MEREAGMEVFFIPCRKGFTPRRLRGGCEREAVAGGGVFPMIVGTSPPPKNSPCEFLPPPRRRRRVRYMKTFIIPKQNKSPPY